MKYLLRERLDAAAAAAGRIEPTPQGAPATSRRHPLPLLPQDRACAAPAASIDPSPPPSATGPTPATPLLPPDRCLGRDTEIADLVATLTAPRPGAVVVLGGPGMGKTTLTRAVATHPEIAARFAERRWFVPLETAADAASLRTAVVLALDGNPADPAAFDHALATLGSAPALLVLDNLETPYDADTTAVRDTLRRLVGVPSLTLLCSYRGQPPRRRPPSRTSRWCCRYRRTPRAACSWSWRHASAPTIRTLRRSCANSAACRWRSNWSPCAPRRTTRSRSCGTDWQRHGVELAKDPDQPEGRLTSLVRSIDLSWRSTRLHDEGRRLFRLLGALPAGMAREDRTALLGDDATEAARQLLAIGLAVSADGRLDLLPPVRGWAQRMAPATEAETDLWCRHYLGLITRLGADIGATGGAAAVARLTPELPNLNAAFAAALSAERRAVAVTAVNGLGELQAISGLGTSAALLALAGACSANDDASGDAVCRYAVARVAFYRSQHDAARAAYEQALPLYRQVGDVLGEANCIRSLGDIALARSDHDAARAAYEQALPLYRQVGDVLGEANCIKSLGDIALARSRSRRGARGV